MGAPTECIQPNIERAVVVEHPKYWETAAASMEELRDAGFDTLKLRSRPTVEGNMTLMAENLQSGDAVLIHAGDGTRSKMIGAALRLAASEVEEERTIAAGIAFTSSKGGRGRDAARADHGWRHMNARPSWLLRNSVQAQGWGMKVSGTAWDFEAGQPCAFETTASSYTGLGKTALATDILARDFYNDDSNDIRDSKGRLRDMLALGLTTLFDGDTFRYYDETGQEFAASDLTFGKGHCMAKFGWLPIEYWDREIMEYRTNPGLRANMSATARLYTNTLRARRIAAATITPTVDVKFHIDGDPPKCLVAGKPFSVALTQETYNILTTRRRRPSPNPNEPYYCLL